MNPVQYIFVNKTASRGKPMSAGKVAAQASHAAVGGYDASKNTIIDEWWERGPAKVVLELNDEFTLRAVEADLKAYGIKTFLVVDQNPTTENTGGVATALGVEILDKDKPWVSGLFSKYKLYSEKPEIVLMSQSETRSDFFAKKCAAFTTEGFRGAPQRQSRKYGQEEALSPEQQFKALEDFNKSLVNRWIKGRKKDFAGFPVALTGRPVVKRPKPKKAKKEEPIYKEHPSA